MDNSRTKMNLDFNGQGCELNTGHKPMDNIKRRIKTPEKNVGITSVVSNFYMPNIVQQSSSANSRSSIESYNSNPLYHNSDPHKTGL